uniref:(northern house mosquito) hypothetical protein n=1 Tax=Culex pipiens TaxID=7175 RepID=A0A8D8F808_CULPI
MRLLPENARGGLRRGRVRSRQSRPPAGSRGTGSAGVVHRSAQVWPQQQGHHESRVSWQHVQRAPPGDIQRRYLVALCEAIVRLQRDHARLGSHSDKLATA